MNNTYFKILKTFISNKNNEALTKRVWEWLVDSNNQREKDEVLFVLWSERADEADKSTLQSLRKFKNSVKHNSGQKRTYVFRRWAQVAATLLLCMISFATAYFINSNNKTSDLVEVYVPKGERKQIVLSDHSTVYLNSNTLLVYPKSFEGESRMVYLMGEGNFSVTRDPKHPFIVKTKNQKVKVLGTQFNLHAYPEDSQTITTLETGKVVVQDLDDKEIAALNPNEQLIYNNQTKAFQKNKAEASLYSGWTKGELNFVSTTLKEIFTTIERVYDVHIVLPMHITTNDVYTIKFKPNTSLIEVINIITKTIGNIEYTIKDENVILIDPIKKKKGGL